MCAAHRESSRSLHFTLLDFVSRLPPPLSPRARARPSVFPSPAIHRHGSNPQVDTTCSASLPVNAVPFPFVDKFLGSQQTARAVDVITGLQASRETRHMSDLLQGHPSWPRQIQPPRHAGEDSGRGLERGEGIWDRIQAQQVQSRSDWTRRVTRPGLGSGFFSQEPHFTTRGLSRDVGVERGEGIWDRIVSLHQIRRSAGVGRRSSGRSNEPSR